MAHGRHASGIFTAHFIASGTEYRASEMEPQVGDTMRHNGDEWIVVDVQEHEQGNTVVKLRPVNGTEQVAPLLAGR